MAKKAKKKTAAKKKAAAKEMLLVGSKVKAAIKEKGCMCSGELMEALNEVVHWILGRAIERAEANKRRTVKAQDV